MTFNLPKLLHDGQEYMQIWPTQKQLYAFFPESKVIAATKFSIKVMPAAAVISVALQLNYFGFEHLAQALTTGVFFLSLPIQGLLWLGHRSSQPLPPSIERWYKQIYATMQEKGCALERLQAKPRFKELANLLKTAYSEMDRAFTKQMF